MRNGIAKLFGQFICAGLLFSAGGVAACEIDVRPNTMGSTAQFMYEGYCQSKDDAMSACVVIAESHGYSERYCGLGGSDSSDPMVAGGWFQSQYGVQKIPFSFVKMHYGTGQLSYRKEVAPPACSEQCLGDPVNSMTGGKFERESIISSGSGLLNLDVYYNSLLQSKYYSASYLGFGGYRSFSFGGQVMVWGTPGNRYAYVSRPDGQLLKFIESDDGWIASDGAEELESDQLDGGWKLTLSNHSIELYDADGNLREISNVQGRYIALSYEDEVLSRVEDDQGRSIQFYWNDDGFIEKVVSADGQVFDFGYESGYLSTITYPDGSTRSFLYDESEYGGAAGLLTGMVDEGGERYSSTWYDDDGRAVKTELAGGVDTYEFSFSGVDGDSREGVVTLPSGALRSAEQSISEGGVAFAKFVDSCDECVDKTSEYSFDSNGRVNEKVLNGISYAYSYNGGNLVDYSVAVGGAALRHVTQEWGDDHFISSRYFENDLGGAVERWSYDDGGLIEQYAVYEEVTGASRSYKYEYCDSSGVEIDACPLLGELVSVDGPRNDVTDVISYLYRAQDADSCASSPTSCSYRKGDLWEVVDPLGHTSEILTYDGAGRVTSLKDPNGVVTDYTYHARGWLTSVTVQGEGAAGDRVTSIDYFPTGLISQITDPDGVTTAFTYDAAHRLTDITDGAGGSIHYTLDNAGNRVAEEVTDSSGNLKRQLSRVFNQLGQLTTLADASANPTDFGYDANGNVTATTDALGRSANSSYDALNRLSESLQDVGGIEAKTTFAYDALDNVTKVVDPKGLATSYSYNGFGELTTQTSPDTGTTTFTYDEAGNVKTRTDARGVTSSYTYDALNRMLVAQYPDPSSDIAYTYDVAPDACATDEQYPVGRLSTMVDGSGETDYCYDAFGDVVRKVQVTNGQPLVTQYSYTTAGRLASVVYPDGALVDYVRNSLGQITEVGVTTSGGSRQVLLTGAGYLPFGPSTGWQYGNGRSMTRSYDLDYRPVGVVDSDGAFTAAFGYDPVGDLTSLQVEDQQADLGYDALGRLLSFSDAASDAVIEQYSYDATGNRLSFTNTAGTDVYGYPDDSHHLTSVAGLARDYDAMGNTTAVGGTAEEFVYDDRGRMAQVLIDGAVAQNYAYNGKGERVRRWLGDDATLTAYNEGGQWLGDYDAAGIAKQQVVWMDDMPVGLLEDGQLYYIEPDHLGSPRLVADPARNVPVWRWDLTGEAFGSTVPNEDPDGDGTAFVLDMRFPGQRFDAVSGLNYNYFRDYEQSAGRYVESDPIGLAGGVSGYAYVGGNPINEVDFYGLTGDPLVGYKPAYGPIIAKTPTTPISWGEKIVSSLIVGKVTLNTTSVNKYGQLTPKPATLLGRLSVFAMLMEPVEMDCSDIDCNKNNVADFLERESPNACLAPGSGMLP